jgi:hypothetical protein
VGDVSDVGHIHARPKWNSAIRCGNWALGNMTRRRCFGTREAAKLRGKKSDFPGILEKMKSFGRHSRGIRDFPFRRGQTSPGIPTKTFPENRTSPGMLTLRTPRSEFSGNAHFSEIFFFAVSGNSQQSEIIWSHFPGNSVRSEIFWRKFWGIPKKANRFLMPSPAIGRRSIPETRATPIGSQQEDSGPRCGQMIAFPIFQGSGSWANPRGLSIRQDARVGAYLVITTGPSSSFFGSGRESLPRAAGRRSSDFSPCTTRV